MEKPRDLSRGLTWTNPLQHSHAPEERIPPTCAERTKGLSTYFGVSAMADATNYDLAKSYLEESAMLPRTDERDYVLRLAQVYATLSITDALTLPLRPEETQRA